MSLIYTVIARGELILSDFTPFSGNFILTVQQILKMCSPTRKYIKYSANNYIFYVFYLDVIYMVMCDLKYSQRIAFDYLKKISKLFTTAYSQQRIFSSNMYGCKQFQVILKNNMELYNTPDQVDKAAQLFKQTDQVSQIINQDLQKLIQRGEKIDILVRKTEIMSALSLDMRNNSKTIKNQMTWRNWKMKIIIALCIIFGVYILFVLVCGNFSLSGCF